MGEKWKGKKTNKANKRGGKNKTPATTTRNGAALPDEKEYGEGETNAKNLPGYLSVSF